MIRNVVIHMQGEQPLLADIQSLPSASDACIVCTNLRTTSGKRPTFVDRVDSWFLFPLVHVRFVEMPPDSLAAEEFPALEPGDGRPAETDELEVDEDFLRRIREA